MIGKQLSLTTDRPENNGQIFVIGAMIIAIMLVSLAFSLNMVIYSENTAARGSAVAEETSLDHFRSLNHMTKRTIDAHTEKQYMSRSNISTSTTEGMNFIVLNERKRQGRQSTMTTISYTPTYGMIMAQNNYSRKYLSEGGLGSWQLTTDKQPIVKFKQRIDRSALSQLTVTEVDSGLSDTNAYAVKFTSDVVNNKSVYIYRYKDTGNTRVHVVGKDPCIISGTPTDININYVKNTVNNTSCPQLGFINTYEWGLTYLNGSNAKGVYGIIVGNGTQESEVVKVNFNDPNKTSVDPYYHHVISKISYTTNYKGPKQIFQTTKILVGSLPNDTQ